jgi:Na+/H+-dicarboxylate symporter
MRKHKIGATAQIVIAMLAGALLGALLPGVASHLRFVGDIFINAVKMMVVPLLLCSIALGIADLRDIKNVGTVGIATLAFAAVTNLLSSFFGTIAGVLTHPGAGLKPLNGVQAVASGALSWNDVLLSIVPENIVDAMAKSNLLAVIAFSVLVGLAILGVRERAEPVVALLRSSLDIISAVLKMVIAVAPFAVFALIANVVATTGWAVLVAMMKMVVVVWVGIAAFIVGYVFVIHILFLRSSPLQFFRKTSEASLMALATCSGMVTMPVTIRNATELGVPRDKAALVVGTGTALINGGSSFYKAAAVVFVASLYGTTLTLHQLCIVVLLSAFLVTAGVPAAGTMSVAVALTMFGIPLEGIAALMAIDRIRDMPSTWGNVISHALGARLVHHLSPGTSVEEPQD